MIFVIVQHIQSAAAHVLPVNNGERFSVKPTDFDKHNENVNVVAADIKLERL